MAKKVKYVISNDWHLQSRNLDQKKDLVRQKIELCKKVDCDKVIIAGDIFESRVSQRQDVLSAFGEILGMFNESNIYVFVIVGNHDKTVYTSKNSFLDSYSHHPMVHLVNDVTEFSGVVMVPFFTDEILTEIIPKGEEGKVLVSHFAVTGSKNNDGTIVENGLTQSMFADYDVVLLGHYHNHQVIGKNIVHMPSLQQESFAEDDNKGFTLLYDDHTWEIVNSEFRKYVDTYIDVDKLTKKEVTEIISKIDTGNVNRVTMSGSKEKLKVYKDAEFASRGISLKKKDTECEINDNVPQVDYREIKEDDIIRLFGEFCEMKGYNQEEGLKFLNYGKEK